MRGDCPSCHEPITVAADARAATCPTCRAPISVAATPVPDAAFRETTFLDLVEIPQPPPDEVTDLSTRDELALVLRTSFPRDAAARLEYSWAVLVVIGAALGQLAPIEGGLMAAGALYMFGRDVYRRFRRVRSLPRELRLRGAELDVDGIRRRDEIARVAVVPMGKTDAIVRIIPVEGKPYDATPRLSVDAAHWVARRLRGALKKG